MKTISFVSQSQSSVITETARYLKKGGLVVFPSDTVYGLLVDATNEKAVQKLLKFKNRPVGKAISIFTNWSMLPQTVTVTKTTLRKLKELLPGPYTIVLPSKHKTSQLLESEEKTLGIRIPNYNLINTLVTRFKGPITATSANLAGRSPHYSITSLLNSLSDIKKNLIDLIVDTGTLPRRKPSTVVDLTTQKIKILRKGDVGLQKKTLYISNSENETKKIAKKLTSDILKKKISKAIVFILKGELGAGKTIFVKGVGELFELRNIISPTYAIMYEYIVNKTKVKKLVHVDLYNVTSPEEFQHLGFEKILEKGNVICIEWGEKTGDILDVLQQRSDITYVEIKHLDRKRREICFTK